jgi:lysophospholipid acyltransferase (LPLAT)-like uncharacterized protein
MRTTTLKARPLHLFQGWGLSTYAGLIGRTARYQVREHVPLSRIQATGRPLIVAAWHGMTMMLTSYLAATQDLDRYVLIVPDDPRGVVLSAWAHQLGIAPFPISMKADSMVAARRLLALIRQLGQGRILYVNPDGPYGPSHEPKGGVVYIARKAGATIIPTASFTATGVRIPRWDRYTVPFPFSRISVVFGEPLEIPPDADPEHARALVRQRLNDVEQAAEDLYHTRA